MRYILRSEQTELAHHADMEKHANDGTCPLCLDPGLKTFTHWKLLENSFPYDLIADTHHMIVPLRHASGSELTQEEWREYQELKQTLMQEYDQLVENTERHKTIPQHFHVHLLVIKK